MPLRNLKLLTGGPSIPFVGYCIGETVVVKPSVNSSVTGDKFETLPFLSNSKANFLFCRLRSSLFL